MDERKNSASPAEEAPAGKMCFISHCSDDAALIGGLSRILKENFIHDGVRFFNSSDEDGNEKSGEARSKKIRRALRGSKLMVAVITDSYLRSVIALSEISAFWYANKFVIPIVFDQDGVSYLDDLLGESRIRIRVDASDPASAKKAAKNLVDALTDNGFRPDDRRAAEDALSALFRDVRPARPTRRYIGSGENYDNIDRYCDEFGITRLQNTGLNGEELSAKLRGAEAVFIVATTGSGLIATLATSYLSSALADGVNVTVLIPNRFSDFANDVAEIESPEDTEDRRKRFAREFDGVVHNLRKPLTDARKLDSEKCGEIWLGCAFTAVRQTVMLGVWKDRLWGRLSVTLPPLQTLNGTPTFEFAAARGENSIADLVYGHVLAIRDMAERRGAMYALSDHLDFQAFFLENETAEQYWNGLYQQARLNSRLRDGKAELIEVAAQHPLLESGRPGKEFARRLDRAAQLYRELSGEGIPVRIYVPGSVHCFRGKADPCSLSEAGRNYLLTAGIPEADLLGDEMNRRYKGEQGVYNTADECFVASRIFFDGDYRRLHCVCSPNQIQRKKLFYIAFGVIPYYHTVSLDSMAHDEIYELFHSVPDIIARDHTWQDPDSAQGRRTRAERDPRLAEPQS